MKQNRKLKIPQTVLERRAMCLSQYMNRKLKVTLWLVRARKKKEGIFCTVYYVQRGFFKDLCLISMYIVLNTLSEYTYFYISKNITLFTFVALFLKSLKAFSVSLMKLFRAFLWISLKLWLHQSQFLKCEIFCLK